MVYGKQSVVVALGHGIIGQIEDDEVGEVFEVKHLAGSLDAVAGTEKGERGGMRFVSEIDLLMLP